MLKLSEASKLLDNDYLDMETGKWLEISKTVAVKRPDLILNRSTTFPTLNLLYNSIAQMHLYGLTSDNLMHVCASTYMPGVDSHMIDWWFGFIHTTEHYLWWHPRDHVFSSWAGPRNNDSTYIGGTHLVHEYIGGELEKLKISFVSPAVYFGRDYQTLFAEKGYGTAICGRVGSWNDEDDEVQWTGHLIHLVKVEPDGVRMRSRFWLGDVRPQDKEEDTDANTQFGNMIPESMSRGLVKHCSEEMAILAGKLPALYEQHSRPELRPKI